jgi:predicted ATPase
VTPPGQRPEIKFALLADAFALRTWSFFCGPEDDLLPLAHYDTMFVGDGVNLDQEPSALDFTLFNSGFQYLRADRINPATTYPRSHEMSVRRGFLGVRGEYAIDYLRYHQDDVVRFDALHHPEASSPRLHSQVEAWMSEICPGVRIQATALEKADLVQLGFQFAGKQRLTPEPQRPTNVGFGLTYVLPVIIACLAAQPGAMILLENPEAHIHPRGQSAMARLTCAAAAIGAQLVVETHSDHILNGVRLSVKREILPAEHVVLHYFRREDDGIHVVSPMMGPDGMLSQWPPGFFDEWDHSLDQLLD